MRRHRQLVNAFVWTLAAQSGQTILSTRGSTWTTGSVASLSLSCGKNDIVSTTGVAGGEVVGANGRMGSFLLRSFFVTSNNNTNLVAVPQGVAPGCLSPKGTPIIVATPSQAWPRVQNQALQNRRNDLVWVGNGLPMEEFKHATIVVPHYGVLCVGGNPVTSPISPPTIIYGQHATVIQEILKKYGINTLVVTEWRQVQVAAARKLLWASCMWLLCHCDIDKDPISVSQAHAERRDQLDALVKELSPAFEELTGQQQDAQSLGQTLQYLEKYSLSIPEAIPSKELGMVELQDRNGVWLRLQGERYPQSLHKELLSKVAGPDILQEATKSKSGLARKETDSIKEKIDNVGLTIWGRHVKHTLQPNACQEVVVIGAGIIGSCVALNLARRGAKVTVYDRLSPKDNVGATSPASWAWINANGKFPSHYQWLNQLGMRAWRYEPTLSSLPTWSGSLVALKEVPEIDGGHQVEGPLTPERIKELEPQVTFPDEGQVYHFPQDGSVDPSAAVEALHKAASALGVVFVTNECIVDVTRDHRDHVTGIVSRNVNTNETSTRACDVVIAAAGVGASADALGGIPLLDRPGQIALWKQQSSASKAPRFLLRRILVDTIRRSHVLQRNNGDIVVGGGELEVGGSSTANRTDMLANADGLAKGVFSLVRSPVLGDMSLSHTNEAARPIPRDGLPAVGYVSPGLYCAVTHSGVTLAPLIGALVAAEVSAGMSCDLLKPYRPTRFSS